MNIKKELSHKFISNREAGTNFPDYDNERDFFMAITTGNLNLVTKLNSTYYKQRKAYGEQSGKLSDNPAINRKYYFVMLASTIVCFCIEAGLDRETALALSAIYIDKADKLSNLAKIDELENDMIFEFTKRMAERHKKNIYSKQITKCMDYIYENLHHKISVSSIANQLDMAPTYLSKLFSKETGMPLSAYIKEQRLIAAANMLVYTNNSISEISEYFIFSSQSHFTTSFQNKYGVTPKKYRDKHTVSRKPTLS